MSPDLNSGPGPKQSTSPIELALGKFDPSREDQWRSGFRWVEVDLQTWFRGTPATRLRHRKRIAREGLRVLPRWVLRTGGDPDAFSELLEATREEFGEQWMWMVVSSGRKSWDPERDRAWLEAIEGLPAPLRDRLQFEFGEEV